MTAYLVTVSMYMEDVDLAEVLKAADIARQSARLNVLAALERNDATPEQIQLVNEKFSVFVSITERETITTALV